MAKSKKRPKKGPHVEWIASTRALEAFCTHIREHGFVAVDTEFHREHTYFSILALVQLGTDDRIACVDPLADGLNLTALKDILLDDSIIKVMHASRQDLEIFYERTGSVPAPLFDTQVAAALLGMGDQLSYGAVVESVLGVRLKKTQGRTDWMRRPLHADVIDYAGDDVRYLPEVYRRMNGELEGLARREWLDEEQVVLSSAETYQLDTVDIWLKVKGAGTLRGVGCAVAQRIAAWRETYAREVDRPKRRVLSDELVIDIARQAPSEMAQLERMRALSDGIRKKHGQTLLDIVEEAVGIDRSEWPKPQTRVSMRPVDDGVVDLCAAVLQLQARRGQVNASLLANRDELKRLAAGERDLKVLRGWRKELAGERLLDLVEGRIQLYIKKDRLIVESVPNGTDQ